MFDSLCAADPVSVFQSGNESIRKCKCLMLKEKHATKQQLKKKKKKEQDFIQSFNQQRSFGKLK